MSKKGHVLTLLMHHKNKAVSFRQIEMFISGDDIEMLSLRERKKRIGGIHSAVSIVRRENPDLTVTSISGYGFRLEHDANISTLP